MSGLSRLFRPSHPFPALRKNITGVDMQKRKEIRRVKKLNVYSRELTGRHYIIQANRTNTAGSSPRDIKHSGPSSKPPEMYTQAHSPSRTTSRRKSARNSQQTVTGSTTSIETKSLKSTLRKKSGGNQSLKKKSPICPPISERHSPNPKRRNLCPSWSIRSSYTTHS